RDFRVLGEPFRDGLSVRRVPLHAHREGLGSAEDEPRVEWAGHAAGRVLDERDTGAQILVRAGEASADHIGMATEIFGRRMQDEGGAEAERLLQIWAREGVVDDGAGLTAMGDLREGYDVEGLQMGIRCCPCPALR